MPHLSPMPWILVMLMMWLTVLNLMTNNFQKSAPTFFSSQVNKSLKSSNIWTWTLQGGRD